MNRLVIITGGSRGIGAETARVLSRAGSSVALIYNSSVEPAKRVQSEIQLFGGVCEIFKADVSVSGDVKRVYAEIVGKCGKPFALVNCAGVAQQCLFTDITDEMWRKMIDTDLSGTFYFCREVLPDMIHEKRGKIVNIASMWGEVGASLRYLTQRMAMPYSQVIGILTDVGTEELAHVEMVSTILYQLTRNLTPEEIEKSGFSTYFVDHTTGIYPVAASGYPYSASQFQSKGDVLTDLNEDLAAEQKARTTYDNILRLVDDPDVCDPIKFLRAREIVHYQRFCDALRIAQDNMDSKNFYGYNPAFDKGKK